MSQTVTEALLESWQRQCTIMNNAMSLVDESNKHAKPSEDGMPLFKQMAHTQAVRVGWLESMFPKYAEGLDYLYTQEGETWVPCDDLEKIRKNLLISQQAIHDALKEAIETDRTELGAYDHPVYFVQHMIWHEGYHFALIMLALRNIGIDPTEEWEEEHVWGLWRTE